jgi:cation transport ATPase
MGLPAESSGILAEPQTDAVTSQESSKNFGLQAGHAPRPLWIKSVWLGCILCVVGVAGFLLPLLNVGQPLLFKAAGVASFVAAGFLAFELVELLKTPTLKLTPLSYVPLAGASLVCGASIFAAFDRSLHASSIGPELLGGPSLTVGAVIIVRALINRLWERAESQASLISGFLNNEGKVIAEGEVFKLTPGILVPTDGRIGAGSCAVLERYLSPDVHFRVKDEGDVVFAGSYVLGGGADVQALTGTYDSCIKRLEAKVLPGVRWVEDSLRRDHEHLFTWFSYGLMVLGVACAIFWDKRGADAVSILSSSGVILLTALVAQIGEGLCVFRSCLVRSWAQRGFLINSAKTWNELYNVHEIAFDASRLDGSTACHVKSFELMDDRISEQSLCACLSSILGRADDRALSMIGDYCKRVVGAIAPERVVDLHEYEGRGICGSVKGIEFSIGSEDFLVARGILIQPSEGGVDEGMNDHVVLVAIGDEIFARIHVAFGQQEYVTADAVSHWPKGIHANLLAGTERDLHSDALLVRGPESDTLGRAHSPEVVLFNAESPEVPASSVIALTQHIEALPDLVKECRKHVRDVLRARAWVLFAGFVSVSLVFAGFANPLIPIGLLPILALCIIL